MQSKIDVGLLVSVRGLTDNAYAPLFDDVRLVPCSRCASVTTEPAEVHSLAFLRVGFLICDVLSRGDRESPVQLLPQKLATLALPYVALMRRLGRWCIWEPHVIDLLSGVVANT